MIAPAAAELAELQIADEAERWAALGFEIVASTCTLGGVTIHLSAAGSGITGWSIRGLEASIAAIDGLPTAVPAPGDPRPTAVTHPNGATGIDHVVVLTADFERTGQALREAGIPLKRIRHVGPQPGSGGLRQGFRRLGPTILELVEAKQLDPARTQFWGLVVIVEDLDALSKRLGDRLGEPRAAVQPGRRIATLRAAAGLTTKLAFMTVEP